MDYKPAVAFVPPSPYYVLGFVPTFGTVLRQ